VGGRGRPALTGARRPRGDRVLRACPPMCQAERRRGASAAPT
jgi:hypothetical protein